MHITRRSTKPNPISCRFDLYQIKAPALGLRAALRTVLGPMRSMASHTRGGPGATGRWRVGRGVELEGLVDILVDPEYCFRKGAHKQYSERHDAESEEERPEDEPSRWRIQVQERDKENVGS